MESTVVLHLSKIQEKKDNISLNNRSKEMEIALHLSLKVEI